MQLKLRLPALAVLFIAIVFCCADANSQSERCPYDVFLPNQEVRVASLPSTVAASTSESDVLAASVATAVLERDICCGRNSALENRVSSARLPLKELGEKLQGSAYLDDGSPIVVTDQYWSGASVKPEDILSSLMAQRPLLMDWSGHLYVLYGAVFDEYRYSKTNIREHVIRTLLLIDTRFSDRQRFVSFDMQKEDRGKVTGLLAMAITRNK
jgi:hypothetical protein